MVYHDNFFTAPTNVSFHAVGGSFLSCISPMSPGGGCDNTTVISDNLLCQFGCSGNITDICTNFRLIGAPYWEFNENRLTRNVSGNAVSYITLFTGNDDHFNFSQTIRTKSTLRKRSDTGRINSTPRALTNPMVLLQEGCNHTIALAVNDPDDDTVRCRWAEDSA